MKRRERILLVAFVALFLILVGGGLVAVSWQSLRVVTEENAGLRRQVAEMTAAVDEGARWEERSAWLEKNIPTYGSAEESSARLLETVQAEAGNAHLTIAGKELLPTSKDPDGLPTESCFEKSVVKLSFNAVSEAALFAWMHALQQPERFLGVTSLQIAPSPEGGSVNSEVQITLFYRNAGQTIVKAR